MERQKQLKVGLLVALIFAVFFGAMLVYFIIEKNLWMCIAMALLLFSSCVRSLRLYKKIKD
jgi:uncharacterized membrane protein YoaK (UPF0700 family)